MSITSQELESAKAALPEALRDVVTAVIIQAMLHVTARDRFSLSVAIPSDELEPLLAGGFVQPEQLQEDKDSGSYRVIVGHGRVLGGSIAKTAQAR